jgi:hypothetical protein
VAISAALNFKSPKPGTTVLPGPDVRSEAEANNNRVEEANKAPLFFDKLHARNNKKNSVSVAERALSAEEQKIFFSELEQFYTKIAISTVNPDVLRPRLQGLNARGHAGVISIIKTLEKPAQKDKEVGVRLALVDYLKYRSRWDPTTQDRIVSLVTSKLDLNTNDRYLAIDIADRAELIGGLASTNWEKASAALVGIKDETLRKYATAEAFVSLQESGISRVKAIEQMKKLDPNFKG